MPFYNWNEIEVEDVMPKVTRKIIYGERIMLVYYELEPGTEFPSHKHPHEQIGNVIQGQMEFTLGDEKRIVGPGDVFVIPSDVEHGAKVIGDKKALVIDTFSPIREDFLKNK